MADKQQCIRIGLLGFGTVGQGVWKHISRISSSLEAELGVQVQMTRALVSDIKKPRDVKLTSDQITDQVEDIIDDPEIDIICELIGGVDQAYEYTMRAFKNGKTVITANKALLCEHGAELFAAAKRCGVQYFFEASVAGGIPIIKTMREALVGNRFSLICGILNGTSNYILTRMTRELASYDTIVNDARDLGYMEADESLDLDGWDAAHKLVVLAYLAHGIWVKLEDFPVEGIRNISTQDIKFADELGYKIKLLGVIKRDLGEDTLSMRLQPTLLPKQDLIAQVDDVYNGVSVCGDMVGNLTLVGRGAGQDATTSAVVCDIADAVRSILEKQAGYQSPSQLSAKGNESPLKLSAPDNESSEFYLRLKVKDVPGALSQVSGILSDAAISIASMIQQEEPKTQSALIFLTTHETSENAIQKVLKQLQDFSEVLEQPLCMRILG